MSLRIKRKAPPRLPHRVKVRGLYFADVAELADALDSGSSGSNTVWVQVPSSAPTSRLSGLLFIFVFSLIINVFEHYSFSYRNVLIGIFSSALHSNCIQLHISFNSRKAKKNLARNYKAIEITSCEIS